MFDKKEYNRQWRKDNPEKIREQRKRYRDNNPEKVKEQKRLWYLKNKDKKREKAKQYYENNKEKIKEDSRQYRKNNIEGVKEYQRTWRRKNLKKLRITRNKNQHNRLKTDLKYNLNKRMSKAIGISLKGNKAGRHWEDLVGYTLKDLIKRLKSTMPEGYDWQDFLDGRLHIDHKIPISAWDFSNPNQMNFQKCWGLSNLQLLPAKENRVKYNKLTRPFQLALKLSLLERMR